MSHEEWCCAEQMCRVGCSTISRRNKLSRSDFIMFTSSNLPHTNALLQWLNIQLDTIHDSFWRCRLSGAAERKNGGGAKWVWGWNHIWVEGAVLLGSMWLLPNQQNQSIKGNSYKKQQNNTHMQCYNNLLVLKPFIVLHFVNVCQPSQKRPIAHPVHLANWRLGISTVTGIRQHKATMQPLYQESTGSNQCSLLPSVLWQATSDPSKQSIDDLCSTYSSRFSCTTERVHEEHKWETSWPRFMWIMAEDEQNAGGRFLSRVW